MPTRAAAIELYYWPGIPGRGEFVRLLLEDGGTPYIDVVRSRRGGMAAMQRILDGQRRGALPLAPPFVVADGVVVSQTANILAYLAPRCGLAPAGAALRAEALQIQLTIADLLGEVHDVHHPISSGLYYEDQRAPARRRARHFVGERLPKFLGWLEQILARNVRAHGPWLVGTRCTYVDLSAFQLVAGLHYAFPNAMAGLAPRIPLLLALHDRVAQRPRLARYLRSTRRQPFNRSGIFRHYPELDPPASRRRRPTS
ncbi:MAG: glutathione S-transferase [Deltaproteobacteria bacterium]|nr:glutathione S-transferase [Deltaproteobacteria bacterium]